MHIAALGNGGLLVATSHDFTGDRHPDVVGHSSDGALHLYVGTGSAIAGSRVAGTGWNGASPVARPQRFIGRAIGRLSTLDGQSREVIGTVGQGS